MQIFHIFFSFFLTVVSKWNYITTKVFPLQVYILAVQYSRIKYSYKIRDFSAHIPLAGPGQQADPSATLSDHLLLAVLQLLRKEVSDHGRHLQQYFHLFLMYSNLGEQEVSVFSFAPVVQISGHGALKLRKAPFWSTCTSTFTCKSHLYQRNI